MYLRKSASPRTVVLDDGQILSPGDLPPAGIRWVASRKAVVARAVLANIVPRAEVLARYQLTEEELDSWTTAIQAHGVVALKITATQKYRQLPVD